MNTIDLIRPQLNRLQTLALVALVVGALLFGGAAAMDMMSGNPQYHFLHSYLYAYLFWFGVTLGSTAFLMIHQVAGSGALFLVRRLLEAASRNLPVMALLFLPIVLGMIHLYAWADPDIVARNHHLYLKTGWLNPRAFIMRALFYFIIWGITVYLLNRWSQAQHDGDRKATHRLSMWSAFGLLLYVLTMTFASFDWIMSLTPLWYSSLYGVIIIVGQGLGSLCMMQVLVTFLTRNTTLTERVPPRYFRDLGNLTLAFTMLWAYTNYSQWGIIWSGNIAEEAEWYTMRTQNSWVYVGAALIVLHFALPFLALLSSSLKVKIENLAKLGLFLLLMRLVDLHWYVTPTFFHDGINISLADIGAPLLLGGIWMMTWVMQMKKSVSLLATRDERFVRFQNEYSLPETTEALTAPVLSKEVAPHV